MKKIYIIGIEGAGTSALATMYIEIGYEVKGSDNGDHFYAEALQLKGIKIFNEYNSDNLPNKIDKVVYSTSIKEENPELQEAKKRNIETLSYPEALAELFNQKYGIAVCGTHGKTTITAMLAQTLKEIGAKPNAIVGSKVIGWQGNSLTGDSEYFVLEADEYQNKLKYYNPQIVILTSIAYDHPDFYKNFTEYKQAFIDFVAKIPENGVLIYCQDDKDVIEIAQQATCKKVSYGFSESSEYRIVDSEYEKNKIKQNFKINYQNKLLGNFQIKALGNHNILNAVATVVCCRELNFNIDEIKKGLNSFQGAVRRFEYIGEKNGAILIDDYAHHPDEVVAILKTAKEIYPQKNIMAIFHPHSFTRTKALLSDFAQSFEGISKVFVLDIYGSAREDSGQVSSQNLVDEINKYSSSKSKAEYIPTIEEAINFLQDKIGKNEVIISIGAGDVWRVTHKLAK